MTTEIPIWVSGKQLWVTGVDKRTTVDEVVATLLGRPDKEYALVEKWFRVERPLNGDTRLLKLWKTWGNDWKDVKLSLKKISALTENDDSGRSSPIVGYYGNRKRGRQHRSRRRRHRYADDKTGDEVEDATAYCGKYGQTVHPRRLSQLSKTQNIEKLLKLILLQGETIQNQISKLRDKESQIEFFESEQHRNRVKSLGRNYLLETYLGADDDYNNQDKNNKNYTNSNNNNNNDDDNNDDNNDKISTSVESVEKNEEDDKADSGMVTECTPSSECTTTPTGEDSKEEDEDEYEFERRVFTIPTPEQATIEEDYETETKRLRDKVQLFERIVKVNKKIEKVEENLVRLYINVERCKQNDKLIADLTASLEQLKNQSDQSENEFKRNSVILNEMQDVLNSRKCYLNKLQNELNNIEHPKSRLPPLYNGHDNDNNINNNHNIYNNIHNNIHNNKDILLLSPSCNTNDARLKTIQTDSTLLSTCPKGNNERYTPKHVLDTLV